jgi:amino acid adenylation domain-containing protein
LDAIFEKAVSQRDDIAVRDDRSAITYGELVRDATRISRLLHESRVSEDSIVALDARRCVEYVVGFVAVLWAGAGVAPIDLAAAPVGPVELARTVNARVVLTARPDVVRREMPGLEVIDQRNGSECDPSPPCVAGATSLAYVLFTSGTEGAPKPVAVERRSLESYFGLRLPSYVPIGARDVVLQVASFQFDGSIRDIVATLTAGATLQLVDEETHRDPATLVTTLARGGVDHLLAITPSLLSLLLDEARTTGREFALRTTLVSGESASLLAPFRDQLPMLGRLVNHWGSTETTFALCAHTVDVEDPHFDTVGEPLPGVELVIVGKDGLELPMGAAGEICVRSDGLARGYLAADGTVERLPEMDVSRAAARGTEPWTRTGDLGRVTPRGIQHLGRRDRQVKVNGHRVELTNVEQILNAVPGVVRSAAAARRGDDSRTTLHVAVQCESVDTEGEIRSRVQQGLGLTYLPLIVHVLDTFPTTGNEKIDWAGIERAATNAREAVDASSPKSGTERQLVRLWSEVLELEAGTATDFVGHGGDSVRAVTLASRIREDLGVDVRAIDVLDSRTPASVAEKLESSSTVSSRAGSGPTALGVGSGLQWGPLTVYETQVFSDVRSGATAANNVPLVIDVSLPGVDRESIDRALTSLVSKHPALRTVYELKQSPRARVQRARPRYRALLADAASLDDFLAQFESLSSQPFDLAGDTLLRLLAWQPEPERWVLGFVVHHIAADGDAYQVLVRDFIEDARGGGQDSGATGGSLSVRDVARWSSQDEVWQARVERNVQRAVTRFERAAGSASGPEVRFGSEAKCKRLYFSWGDGSLARVTSVARDAGVTVAVVLLSGFDYAITSVLGCGDPDVVVASSARDDVQIPQELVGYFVDLVRFRTGTCGATGPDERIRRVDAAWREARREQPAPYHLVMSGLRRTGRDLNPAPFAFTYQSATGGWGTHYSKATEVPFSGAASAFSVRGWATSRDRVVEGYVEYDEGLPEKGVREFEEAYRAGSTGASS